MGLLLVIGALVVLAGAVFGYAVAASAGAAPGNTVLQCAAVLGASYFSPAFCGFSYLRMLERIRAGTPWQRTLPAHLGWCLFVAPLSSVVLFPAANLVGWPFGLVPFSGDVAKMALVVGGVMLGVSVILVAFTTALATRARWPRTEE